MRKGKRGGRFNPTNLLIAAMEAVSQATGGTNKPSPVARRPTGRDKLTADQQIDRNIAAERRRKRRAAARQAAWDEYLLTYYAVDKLKLCQRDIDLLARVREAV